LTFDVTLGADERDYRYTSEVHPAPFPDHSGVDTTREGASANGSSSGGSDRRRLHRTPERRASIRLNPFELPDGCPTHPAGHG
jgi:hypothetical protein